MFPLSVYGHLFVVDFVCDIMYHVTCGWFQFLTPSPWFTVSPLEADHVSDLHHLPAGRWLREVVWSDINLQHILPVPNDLAPRALTAL